MRKETKDQALNINNVTGDVATDKTVEVKLKEVFGVEVFGDRTMIAPAPMANCQFIPRSRGNYEFEANSLNAVVTFLAHPLGDALYLYGPSGCGKTSLINEVASRLHWPVLQMTINGRFELADLIGHLTICNKQVVFVHGPLARAMKYGYIVILNEIDLADPAELAGLNDVLEGRSLVIVQNNGEIIEPHPNFRFVVTANTKGDGENHYYSGTQTLNGAFLDRFRFVECVYLTPENELQLLKKETPALTDTVFKVLVKAAVEIRKAHFDYSPDHIYISSPLSTRTLLRWARLITCYKGMDDPVEVALQQAFTNRLTSEEAMYVLRLYRACAPKNLKCYK